jgi:hypothetical protein
MNEIGGTLHRTVKLALDDGSASSIEGALERFHQFRICLDVRAPTTSCAGLEAALLTLLNAAPRTFLGGVEITGDVDQRLHLAWFAGMSIAEAAQSFGVRVIADPSAMTPTVVLGPGGVPDRPFVLALQCNDNGFRLSPEAAEASSERADVECGITAAGAALSEAFQYVYAHAPLAGQRIVSFDLPHQLHAQPRESVWAVGLGHLGQAALWSLALRQNGRPASVRLQDADIVTESTLSTCLLVSGRDVGRLKVDVVAERLEELGIRCRRVDQNLALARTRTAVERDVTLVSVDNVALRRSLDAITDRPVVEAGIGDGIDGFTRVQLHVLPGQRLAADIWASDDPRSSRAVDISAPAYQTLLKKTKDECGITLLAGRSIATPFVGAFAGACMAAVSSAAVTEWDWNLDVKSL